MVPAEVVNDQPEELSLLEYALTSVASDLKDALMLMALVEPADIPSDTDFLKAVMEAPYILLKYIDEDVKLSWPVCNIIDGQAIYVEYGLRTKCVDMEDL